MDRSLTLAGLLLALSGCSHQNAFSTPRPAQQLAELQACDDGSECVRVDNGCCDCANGGSTIAINRKFEKEFRDSFDCRKVVCTQRAGACQFLEPICHDHRCELGRRPQLYPVK